MGFLTYSAAKVFMFHIWKHPKLNPTTNESICFSYFSDVILTYSSNKNKLKISQIKEISNFFITARYICTCVIRR